MKASGALAGLALLVSSAASAAPQVEVFTPQGEAKGVRQVAVRFSEPMVAFGDPRLPEPFEVRCEGDPARLKGRGRWADTRNWVYDFEQDLPAGQRCTFTLKPETKAQGAREFRFNTGGPAVMRSLPNEGHHSIDDLQWFLLLRYAGRRAEPREARLVRGRGHPGAHPAAAAERAREARADRGEPGGRLPPL